MISLIVIIRITHTRIRTVLSTPHRDIVISFVLRKYAAKNKEPFFVVYSATTRGIRDTYVWCHSATDLLEAEN